MLYWLEPRGPLTVAKLAAAENLAVLAASERADERWISDSLAKRFTANERVMLARGACFSDCRQRAMTPELLERVQPNSNRVGD